MRAGRLNKRATFTAPVPASSDDGGGHPISFEPVMTVWAEFVPERGRERIRAGRIQASQAGVLRIRSSAAGRQITTEHRVTVDGSEFEITAIANPDQRNVSLEMTLESVA